MNKPSNSDDLIEYLTTINEENQHTNRIKVLSTINSYIKTTTSFDEVVQCFELVLKHYPNDYELLTSFGLQLCRFEKFTEAKQMMNIALSHNENFLPAIIEFHNILHAIVKRWHFIMLNDKNRNELYSKAINRRINEGYAKVLDVGTGSGILSLFAAKNKNVKDVTACECNMNIAQLAKRVFEKNQANVNLIQKFSGDILIPNDMENKANLLITETFDAGLFGEGILNTLIDAWKNLLEPNSIIIPFSGELYTTAIESDVISRRTRYLKNNNTTNDALRLAKFCFCITEGENDPYDSINLRKYKNKVKYLSDPKKILAINFSNLEQMKKYNCGEDIVEIEIECTEGGQCQALALWFTLNLCPDISLTTSPFEADVNCCWDQAIVNFKHPFRIDKGENFKLKLGFVDGKLNYEIFERQMEKCDFHFEVSESFLSFINDKELVENLYKNALDLGSDSSELITALDISPFPVFGLTLAKNIRNVKIISVIETKSDEEALRAICKVNSLDVDAKVFFISKTDLDTFMEMGLKFNYIFVYPLMSSGMLDRPMFNLYEDLKGFLKENGTIFPRRLSIEASLIQSDYLSRVTSVDDSNVCGFFISKIFNEYQTPFHNYAQADVEDSTSIGFCQISNNMFEYSSTENVSYKCKLLLNDKKGKHYINGINYWFVMEWFNGYCTTNRLNEDNYYINSNNCFVLKEPLNIQFLNEVELFYQQHQGYFNIDIK